MEAMHEILHCDTIHTTVFISASFSWTWQWSAKEHSVSYGLFVFCPIMGTSKADWEYFNQKVETILSTTIFTKSPNHTSIYNV